MTSVKRGHVGCKKCMARNGLLDVTLRVSRIVCLNMLKFGWVVSPTFRCDTSIAGHCVHWSPSGTRCDTSIHDTACEKGKTACRLTTKACLNQSLKSHAISDGCA